jgi:hypothetical protein
LFEPRKTTEILEVLMQLYGEEVMSGARDFKWCKQFSKRKDEVEFDGRPERPKISKSDIKWSTFYSQNDYRRTEYQYRDYMIDLDGKFGVQRTCSKMVPKNFTNDITAA